MVETRRGYSSRDYGWRELVPSVARKILSLLAVHQSVHFTEYGLLAFGVRVDLHLADARGQVSTRDSQGIDALDRLTPALSPDPKRGLFGIIRFYCSRNVRTSLSVQRRMTRRRGESVNTDQVQVSWLIRSTVHNDCAAGTLTRRVAIRIGLL